MAYILPNDPEDFANRERIKSLMTCYTNGDSSVGPELMRLIGARTPKLREELDRVAGEPCTVTCLTEDDLRPAPVRAFTMMESIENFIKHYLNPSSGREHVSLEELRRQIESNRQSGE